MAPKKVYKLPVDTSITLTPSSILYISPVKLIGTSHSRIFDLTTEYLPHLTDGSTEALNASAKALVTLPSVEPVWSLTRVFPYSDSEVTVIGGAEVTPVATWHSHLLSYGATHIKFSPSSQHCTHPLTVQPLSVWRRAQSFVHDSVTYVWERTTKTNSQAGRLSLFRVVGGMEAGKKVEVSRYESSSGKFEAGGLLAVQKDEIDVLVSVLTLLGVLNQRDAFYMPGLDLVGKPK